jgi:hypothetical protein
MQPVGGDLQVGLRLATEGLQRAADEVFGGAVADRAR